MIRIQLLSASLLSCLLLSPTPNAQAAQEQPQKPSAFLLSLNSPRRPMPPTHNIAVRSVAPIRPPQALLLDRGSGQRQQPPAAQARAATPNPPQSSRVVLPIPAGDVPMLLVLLRFQEGANPELKE